MRIHCGGAGGDSSAAGIARWPVDIGHIDLGERVIDIISIPGHNDASIALYDRRTGNLTTGDSLYPGRLSVSATDLTVFTASAARLAEFARTHPVAHVFGTHSACPDHAAVNAVEFRQSQRVPCLRAPCAKLAPW